MTITMLLLVIAIILMILGSIPLQSPVNLWQLGWAFVVMAWAFGGAVLLR